ncbi:MAG: Tex family protein [Syntrophobacteraceae bacterium]
MNERHMDHLAAELRISPQQVLATGRLLEDGATVPFIARYRKEATGSLDETVITAIRDRLGQLEALDKRREAILKSLEEQGKLTEELQSKVLAADTLALLEDIYLPFRPKRRTRATIAREKGLEPLALLLFAQDPAMDPILASAPFIDMEKGVSSGEDALAGARDIIAEWINENVDARTRLRVLFTDRGVIRSRLVAGKETEGAQFRDYFAWEEPVRSAPSHRVLAARRGEKEGVLSLHIAPPEDDALSILERLFIKGACAAADQVRLGVQDGYKRLLLPSLENEMMQWSKARADQEAIQIFADNLRHLLMAAPLGTRKVIGIDPGFRTGCKVVCLDPQGKLLHNETIYPHTGAQAASKAAERIRALVSSFEPDAIAVGNGTAGRETESFIRGLDLPKSLLLLMVDESGASVYSASVVAREEFPDHDVTVRGAVSIGRRLMDPLSELVKIDPKSIGVGQYQHDVDQGELKKTLDDVVMSCVNGVGVEINTASSQILAYVSGLGPQLARNIVSHRNENGPFRSREALKKVPRLGPKAFQQAAGFLRIRDGKNPLDASAVHPESYGVVAAMARDLGRSVSDLTRDAGLRQAIDPNRYVTEQVGLPTLRDILSELAKPGRDPREQFEAFSFAEGVEKVDDLAPGLRLPGIVTNVTAFGAFVDIGVHRDGLVHVSELSDDFVSDPRQVVRVHQRVTVTVVDVDKERGRIALSMKSSPESKRAGGPKAEATRKDKPSRSEGGSKPKPSPSRKSGFNNPFEEAFKKR